VKIFIVASEYYPMPAAGAARVTPWVEELLNLGHDVLVFSSKCVNGNAGRLVRSVFPTPGNKCSLGKRLFQEVLLGIDIGFKIWSRRKQCELCIVSSPPFFMAFICALFAHFIKIPFIFDVRDRYPRVLSDLGVIDRDSLIYRMLAILESWTYQNTRQITTVSIGLELELKAKFPDLNICLVRNGFDENIFTEDRLSHKQNSDFTVVYHGRLGRFYDLDIYLEVMNLVHELDSSVRFLMIGDFPEKLFSNRPENVDIIPSMPLVKLSELLPVCHLGLCLLRELPAMKNAFPAKAYDYIGAGLPILAGPSGELTDMIEKMGIGVTFTEINPRNVAQKIVEIKNNRALLAQMCFSVKNNRIHFGRREISKAYFNKELSLNIN